MTKYAFVSEQAYTELQDELKKSYDLILIGKNSKCYEAVAKHADIQMLTVGKHLFVDQSIETNKGRWLIRSNPDFLHILSSDLSSKYPGSVPFNAKVHDSVFIHHLEITQTEILDHVDGEKYEKIHVNQGYTNCSLILLPDRKGISADKGIYDTLTRHKFDILFIREGYILLEGMTHGFIGGCCGLDDDRVYVNGDLNYHPDGERIRAYIEASGMKLFEVKNQVLRDIGSIVFWEAEDV